MDLVLNHRIWGIEFFRKLKKCINKYSTYMNESPFTVFTCHYECTCHQVVWVERENRENNDVYTYFFFFCMRVRALLHRKSGSKFPLVDRTVSIGKGWFPCQGSLWSLGSIQKKVERSLYYDYRFLYHRYDCWDRTSLSQRSLSRSLKNDVVPHAWSQRSLDFLWQRS